MKRKYYVTDPAGKMKIFNSFNQMLRYLKLPEEAALKLADVLGKAAFTGEQEISCREERTGVWIEYR